VIGTSDVRDPVATADGAIGTRDALIRIEDLHVHFDSDEGLVEAVRGVDLAIRAGETLGLVGESGSGKSVTAQAIMRLVPDPPGRIAKGRILFDGIDLAAADIRTLRQIRGNRISMIFQEPMTSLNPVYPLGEQIAEVVRLHEGLSRRAAHNHAIELLARVGIGDPAKRVHEYPHQLSGGMRQRVMIAIALACNPELVIADEPTTALDVTIQAQILELLERLKDDFGTAILLITHDLGVVAETARAVAVMYAGQIVEEAEVDELFDHPLHPYTQGLMASIPMIDAEIPDDRMLPAIAGTVPSMIGLPPGCPFQTRCGQVHERCHDAPPLVAAADGHRVRCWLHVS
jgi:peptide/nickel transport system ATP-binding protein/oligopeptide transport system ATP-binding protein